MAAQPQSYVELGLHQCECGEEFVGTLFLAVHQRQLRHGLFAAPCRKCNRKRSETTFRHGRAVCDRCIRANVTADNHEEYEQRSGMTLKEVAEEMGLSVERVRQIEQAALRKLRNNSKVMSAVRQMLEGRS